MQGEEEHDHYFYSTAGEAFPIRIPLERADFGGVKYTLSEGGKVGDLELLYELETSDILVKSFVPGRKGEQPGTLRINNIEAADLSLFNEIPGSLEGIVARLVLETSSDVEFKRTLLPVDEDDEESETTKTIWCRRITLTASVHECGHLRDVLLFLKSDTLTQEIPEDNPYRRWKHHQQQEGNEDKEGKKVRLTFMEGLPHWTFYFPWWLYSGRVRKTVQICLLLYTIFSVVWATWQLYRHFNVIQVALQPIVDALKLYLSSVMELVDIALDVFTNLWTTFLSPLNIFRGIALTPLINVVVRLLSPLVYAFTTTWRLLAQSGFARLVAKPLSLLWQGVLNSRIAVRSLDLTRIRQNLVINLIISSLRSIGQGLAKLFNIHNKKVKKKRALRESSSATTATSASVILSPSQDIHRRNVPVVYSSPIARKK